jgi:hypothetical protein
VQLHPNWKIILKRAWSARLMAAAVILSGLEVTLQVVVGVTGGTIALAILAGVVTGLALWARLVAQKDFPNG